MKRIPKLIKFPEGLVKEIEKYQKENFISSFSGAVYELIRKGLKKISCLLGDLRYDFNHSTLACSYKQE